MNEQATLFDYLEQDDRPGRELITKKIDVVKMEYLQAESVVWQDLFSGFTKIRGITYSSGIDFIYNLLDMFDEAEIIFGCEDVISYSLNEILAYQSKLLERLREKAGIRKQKLLDRIDKGNVHFYVARKKISHEKIYLLEADDGRKRVIMGSANMSFQAFGGLQRENICYLDGDAGFEWYASVFQELKNDSVDEITKTAFNLADAEENIDELPIFQTTKVKKAIVVEPETEIKDDVQFILDTKNLAARLNPMLPKPERKTKKNLIIT